MCECIVVYNYSDCGVRGSIGAVGIVWVEYLCFGLVVNEPR